MKIGGNVPAQDHMENCRCKAGCMMFMCCKLAAVYKACDSKDVRRAMFSATFSYDVEEWCRLNLDNVVQVYIGAR